MEDPRGHDLDPGGKRGSLHEDDELVSAETPDRVLCAYRSRQPRPDRGQELIADAVAQGVVDAFEIVEVQEETCSRNATAASTRKHLLDAVEDQGPVGKPGEAVVQSLVTQLFGPNPDQLLSPGAPRPQRYASRPLVQDRLLDLGQSRNRAAEDARRLGAAALFDKAEHADALFEVAQLRNEVPQQCLGFEPADHFVLEGLPSVEMSVEIASFVRTPSKECHVEVAGPAAAHLRYIADLHQGVARLDLGVGGVPIDVPVGDILEEALQRPWHREHVCAVVD